MDLATVFGIVAGLGLILIAIFLKSGLGIFMEPSSFLIVAGGTVASTLISYPINEVISVIKVAGKAFRGTIKEPTLHMIELIHLAYASKREGLLKLPAYTKRLKDPFIAKGVQMIADRIPREEIIRTLDTEILIMQDRHRLGRDIFQAMGKYAPAFGMIGTLIGLVQMLSSLAEPDKLGPSMATALLTTFYGAVMANMFFLPISNKLKRRSEQEFLLMQISKEALLSIESGETITLLEDKLSSFISRSLHHTLEEQKKAIKNTGNQDVTPQEEA